MKKRKIKWLYIFCLFLMLLTFQITYNYLKEKALATNNEQFIKYLLQDSNYHHLYENNTKKMLKKINEYFFNIEKPVSILENSFGYKMEKNEKLIFNDEYKPNEKITKYIKDPNPKEIKDPIVYIYNTHQLENYSSKNLENYNITPNVMMASYLLKENLNKLGIPSIVEESNITEFLRMNNWNYSESYKASRLYVLDAINKYDNLKLFIDLHRDSMKKQFTTVTINNKNYAKIIFVVGLEYKNYEKNLNVANKINNIVQKQYPNLSKGIIKKGGKGVDGIYNQDLHEGMILIECGGYENNIEEVMNTVNALSKVIKEYLK